MTVKHMWTAIFFALANALCSLPLRAATSDKTIADVRVFAIYEPVFTRRDVELLYRIQPDLVCRGWFKWHHSPDWQAYAPLAKACREKGILLQGGITCAALYPGENGMDDATFRDFACHGTDGQPYPCRQADFGGWYHLSLYNPKVIEYLKREVRLQIDAGAVGIWYDEIEGYYDWNPTEGYDPYACAAFRDWLIRKYCVGQGWREDDSRWQSKFGIALSQHGGSIRTFDYLRHLQPLPGRDGKPLTSNPPQGSPRGWATSPNPLYREWGYAWDRKAQGTFRFDTVAALFADILADADRYALEKYGRTLISTYNHNGTARPGVSFQQPHHGAQPPLWKGRLDGRASYLAYYEALMADAAEVCPGQPVVFFVDWPGETDRLTALPRSDQTHFFALFIPEAYAAGGEFALPLRGYSYVSAKQGTLAYLARMADLYRDYAPWLRGSHPAANQPQAQDRLTVRARTSACGTAVHLVNHAFSTRDVWPQPRTNLCVTLPWTEPAPAAAFAVSPDFPEQRPVPLTLKDGYLTLTVGTLTCSVLVILPNADRLNPVSGTAATGTHILAPQGRALAVAQGGRFTLWLPPDGRAGPQERPLSLECLETGERLPAVSGVVFTAPPSGDFSSGLLLDAFGIPARHAELSCGTRRWHTDAWGRFRIPLAQAADRQATVCVELGATNTLTLNTAFTAWHFSAPRRPIADFASSLDGYWANWPDKDRTPVNELWQSDASFDAVDVDNLRAGHRPQPPPPAVAKRQPLVRFTEEPSPHLLANWDGKSATDTKPMVVIGRVAPAGQAPYLRVTLPAGECAWGNANIPLPAALLQGQDGLALRMRVTPVTESVALALHAMSSGRQDFYGADVEPGEEWAEQVLTWSEFRRPDGHSFQPAQGTAVNLQICRPSRMLAQDVVIDIGTIDGFSAGPAELPDIRTVEPDLTVPAMTSDTPAAGRRVRMTLATYRGTEVYHALYLPSDWQAGKRFPVIVEYAGNGAYSNKYGDVSDGTVEGSRLGYGASGGKGFIWVCAPYVSLDHTRNQTTWWGDVEATVSYCTGVVAEVCTTYGGDPKAVFIAGFSRGSLGCNYIGLHNDAIASLWRGFLCHSHYDGVRQWGYPASDRASAAVRLARLKGRPQFISQEGSTAATKAYLKEACPAGRFIFAPLPFRNHTDAWTLRDIPVRAALRTWLAEQLEGIE